jgi:type I restriction enzyme S subunit
MSFTASLLEIVARNGNGLLNTHPTWSRVGLGEIAGILNGFPFPSSRFSHDIGFPLLRIRDVLKTSTQTRYEGEYDATFILQPGELVVGMDGDFNSAHWRGTPALLNQRVCKITADDRFYDSRFLGYSLPGYLSAINAVTSSITVKHLSSRTIAEIPLPLPPLNEQRRIVQKIEELFSKLDAGVAALERVKANLKRYRAAVLKAAVEGKLTAEWRAQHPDTEPASKLLDRILKERRRKWEEAQLAKYTAAGKEPPKGWREKYKEAVLPETSGRPELPTGWCWSSIGQCFAVHVGATPSRANPTYWGGNIPWVSSGLIQFCRIKSAKEKITEEGLENSSTQINPAGSVLLGMIGEGRTRGQVALLDIAACNNQNCAAIWVSETQIPSEFVYYWLWSRYEVTRRDSSGNNQPALNQTRVEQLSLPLPPLAEQSEIVAEVERRLSIVDELEAQVAADLQRAGRLRQSILKRAFAGRLVPQDPSDEPAAKLLERIEATRLNEKRNPAGPPAGPRRKGGRPSKLSTGPLREGDG